MSNGLLPSARTYVASGCLLGCFVALGISTFSSREISIPTLSSNSSLEAEPASVASEVRADALTLEPVVISAVRLPRIEAATLKVRSGDTLIKILQREGVSSTDAHAVSTALKTVFDPRDIRVGQEIEMRGVTSDTSRIADSIRIAVNPAIEAVAFRDEDKGYVAHLLEADTLTEPRAFAGRISSSLYDAAVGQGVPPAVLVEMTRLFSYDVDFQRDIRKGDTFEVLFDQRVTTDGKVVSNNDIAFASMTLRGDTFNIFAFDHADGERGYYSEEGKGIRKALMRTPINGARLSSSFGARRHPVLGYTKMHKGVDFAAPRGTPIYAAGDGVIEKRQRWGSFGNYIRIRHGDGFSTAYAHMNGFARGYGVGSRVKQGAVIGYVGTTGRSTGPHLHYEVLKNGAQVNPMKVRFPASKTLAGAELEAFFEERDRLLAQWSDAVRSTDVAFVAPGLTESETQ